MSILSAIQPKVRIIQQSPLIMTINDIFTAEYCAKLIEKSEAWQYETAQIDMGNGRFKTDLSVRNNDRVIFDDNELAHSLFNKVKNYLPQTLEGGLWTLSGLNERFRYYRYGTGQTFKVHFDGVYAPTKYHKSFLSLLFYLSDDFIGGETKFYRWQDGWSNHATPQHVIKPQKGQALVFKHKQLHEGASVVSGIKYVLRTDVMYKAGGDFGVIR